MRLSRRAARPDVRGTVGRGTVVILWLIACSAPAGAQTRVDLVFQEQAATLRLELPCRPDTAWPELPRTPREVAIAMAVDSTGVLAYPGGASTVTTSILIPQHAFFFNPTAETCQAVIVVGVEEPGTFYYSLPRERTAGAAPMVFFQLLGPHPEPSNPPRSDPPHSDLPRTDPPPADPAAPER